MAINAGAIALDLGLNTAPISQQVKTAAAGVQTQLGSAFTGVNSKIGSAFKNIGSQTDKTVTSMQSKFSSLFGKLGTMLAGAFAISRIKALAQEWMSLYQTQIQSEIQIAVTMRNATNATLEEIQAVKDLASEYQQLGVIGDEVQLAGMQELATYVSEAESVKKMMPVLNDMVAQQYGYDASSGAAVGIATMLGKVLNGNTTALSRYGYDFTDEQANIIKYGTEAEKVATVTEVIEESVANMNEALAQTPTGKIKQLSNNFGDMKEALGNVVTNICQPFVSVLNVIVVKLTAVFNALARASAALLSIKSFSFLGLGQSASSVSDSIDGITASAEGAGSAMKSLMGFDQLNRLDGGSGSGGSDDNASSLFDFEDEEQLDSLAAKVKEIKEIFAEGFKIGFASADLDAIKQHAKSVKQSLIAIFTSDEVREASKNFADSAILNLGKITGSIASIGATIAENLMGGMDLFLTQRGGDLRKSIADTLNAKTEMMNVGGDLAVALAESFSAFKSDGGKQITAAIMSVFSDATINVRELCAKLGRDVLSAIAKPFTENADSIKAEIEELLEPIGDIIWVLSDRFHEFCETCQIGYDSFVKPALNALSDSLSKLWQEHLQPMWSEVSGFLSRLAELFTAAWEKSQPLVEIMQEALAALGQWLEPIMSIFSDTVLSGLGALADAIGAIFGILSGLLDFVVGVFTGDWEKAWSGIKSAAGSLWNYIKACFQATTVVTYFSGIWEKVKAKFTSMGAQIGSSMASAIKSAINNVISQIQSKINSGIGIINSALSIVGAGKISTVSLPKLAQGGYVKANTPQLAMIGDNKRYGEIVAPEDKMLEMVLTALRLFKQQEGNSNNVASDESQMIELVVNIGGETLARKIIKLLKEQNRRGNKPEFDF